jgi:hypothetical protein
MVLLSAALIVRDEERFLGACLASLAGIVDETVVVDTGSTDGTREIALRSGARVGDFPWRDDFAAARNHALDLARGQWILYIDADERVRPFPPQRLRRQLEDQGLVGARVLLHPRPRFTPYRELRLFRNHPTIRFRGVIHENIWPALDAYRALRGGAIGESDLVVDHEGYEGTQDGKHARNLPLLRRALAEDPSRVFCWCHLASIHLSLGEAGPAEEAWRSALAVVRRKRWLIAEDSLPYAGLIGLALADGRPADDLLSEARERFPGNLQLRWLQGRALMQAGGWREAIALIEDVAARGASGDFAHDLAYDERLFTVQSWEALGACHFKLGQYGESARYFGLAASHAPEKLEYRVKRALAARLAGGPPALRGEP